MRGQAIVPACRTTLNRMKPTQSTRVAVYTDHLFWRDGDDVYTDRVFPVFVAGMAPMVAGLLFVARVDPKPGRSQHKMPPGTEVVPMPWVESLASPAGLLRTLFGSLRCFGRVLGRVDAVWLVGSYLISLPFALMAAARGKRVTLGVRQDLPRYARGRHPRRRSIHLAADALEALYKLMSRLFPIAVVGPELARNFRRGPPLLELSVSLIDESDIVSVDEAMARPYDGEIRILSVGRLDPEKNPLLLADVLEKLRESGRDFRLVVCGDGPLEDELRDRLVALGVGEQAELRGYVSL